MGSIAVGRGGDGIDYWVIRQTRPYSCAAVCLCMILRMKRNKVLTEGQACLLLEHSFAREQGRSDRPAVRAPWIPINWESHGVGPTVLVDALERGLGMAGQKGGSLSNPTMAKVDFAGEEKVPSLLSKIRPGSPGVLGIKTGDGWHAVVVANQTEANFVVLEPASGGVVLCNKDKIDAGGYSPVGLGREFHGDISFLLLVA
jgi:hypothetical protein